jgi:thioredoxin reductase (NADPH)
MRQDAGPTNGPINDGAVDRETDVAVVGAGPIGLELAVALKCAGIDYLHFDARQIGYTISWFAPQTRFFSSNERIAIAGVPLQTPDQNKATREQYLSYLRGVVQQFDLQVNTYEPVTGIDRDARGFLLSTRPPAGPRRYRARRVVLVTGGTDRPRRLNVPGEDLPHVSHYFDDPHKYFRRRVLIVGGKNSAVEAALRCHQAGAHVSLSYRRDALPAKSIKYWLLPEINHLMQAGRIEGHFNTVPAAITPTTVALKAASPAAGAAGRVHEVPADFVLALIGYEQDNALLRLAGVEIRGECQSPVFDERTMETNVPGMYVAGTAVAGTQDKYTVFIENCHVHVERIVAALTGKSGVAAPRSTEVLGLPES